MNLGKGRKQYSTLLPVFSFPKGKQKPNETEVACAIREVDEETSYNIESRLDQTLFFEERDSMRSKRFKSDNDAGHSSYTRGGQFRGSQHRGGYASGGGGYTRGKEYARGAGSKQLLLL